MSLGIPHDDFPVNSEGESLLENHRRWIQRQQEIESTGAAEGAVPMMVDD
jgi:hypothetical protein